MIYTDPIIHPSPSRPMTVEVSFSPGRCDRTITLLKPHSTFDRIDVIGYDARRRPALLTAVCGTPSPDRRVPLLPERFVVIGYAYIPAAAGIVLTVNEPNPRWF